MREGRSSDADKPFLDVGSPVHQIRSEAAKRKASRQRDRPIDNLYYLPDSPDGARFWGSCTTAPRAMALRRRWDPIQTWDPYFDFRGGGKIYELAL